LTNPDSVSSDGTHVWVANVSGNYVTELSAATGGFLNIINGSAYGFNHPDGIYSDKANVWVTNAWLRQSLGSQQVDRLPQRLHRGK
jgi:hypothetical protein